MRPIPFHLPLAVHAQSLKFARERLPGSLLSFGIVAGAILASLGLTYVMVNLSPALALLGLLAVPAGILMVLYPEVGLLLVVSAIPLEDFNQIPGLGGLSVMKLLGLVALAAYLAHYLISDRQEKLVSVPQNVYIALFVLAALASNVVAIDLPTAVDKSFKLIRAISFYFLVINVVRSRTTLHRVLWVVIVAGFLSAVYGLYQYYFTPEVLGSEIRISGTMDDPNGFARLLAVLVPLIWYQLTEQQPGRRKLFLILASLLILWAIVLSGSRNGMITAVGSCGLVALRQKRKVLAAAVVVFIVMVGLATMPDNVKNRIGVGPEEDEAAAYSNQRRMTYQVFGWQLFQGNPIAGVGLSGFTEAYSQSDYRFLRGEDDARRVAHNMYLEIATGTGLLGLVPFILLLGITLYNLQRVACRSSPDGLQTLAQALQISLMGLLFACLFSSAQYDKLLWLLLGLSAIIPTLSPRPGTRAASPSQ